MTANQLVQFFNDTFSLREWPRYYEVNHETYANCCQKVFDQLAELNYNDSGHKVALGPNNGLMFKNVELLLEHR